MLHINEIFGLNSVRQTDVFNTHITGCGNNNEIIFAFKTILGRRFDVIATDCEFEDSDDEDSERKVEYLVYETPAFSSILNQPLPESFTEEITL